MGGIAEFDGEGGSENVHGGSIRAIFLSKSLSESLTERLRVKHIRREGH